MTRLEILSITKPITVILSSFNFLGCVNEMFNFVEHPFKLFNVIEFKN